VTQYEDLRQVTLAYPMVIGGAVHAPDDTIQLPAEGLTGAKQLVRDGVARWAEGTDEGRTEQAAVKSARAGRQVVADAPKEA